MGYAIVVGIYLVGVAIWFIVEFLRKETVEQPSVQAVKKIYMDVMHRASQEDLPLSNPKE